MKDVLLNGHHFILLAWGLEGGCGTNCCKQQLNMENSIRPEVPG